MNENLSPSVDPIAQILQDIQILDVDPFLPPGYKYGQLVQPVHQAADDLVHYEDDQNINDLLR